jgi:hypothetical protein
MPRWSFSTKVNGAGHVIDAADVNGLQTAIQAIEPYSLFTTVPASGWSWLTTQGGASVSTDPTYGDITMTVPAVAGDNHRLYGRTLVAGSNYTVTVYLEPTYQQNNSIYAGLTLRESSSGKLITWGPGFGSDAIIGALKWTNATTYSADYIRTVIQHFHGLPHWFRWRDDGTTRYAEFSYDGTLWVTHQSALRTDFLTADQVGFSIDNTNTGANAYLKLRSYAEV